MKKSRLIILSVFSALALTGCNLFNDNDIKVENHFKTKEEASAPKPSEATVAGVGSQDIKIDETEALVFKSIVYSNLPDNKIKNTYTTANGFAFNLNSGNDYEVVDENNNFDLYIPKGLNKADNQTVVLFIHGGAWVSGLKTHVNPYVKEFTKRGYISATVEYSLLSQAALTQDDMDSETLEKNRTLSVFRGLDEIDACISTLKSSIEELGFTGSLNLVVGGVSSGAHLTMLYSYSRGASCPLPIKFIVNAVGPTDITESVWKAFNFDNEEDYNAALAAGIEYSQISDLESHGKLKALSVSGAEFDWNEYQTMRIANGMTGFPYTPAQVSATTDDKIVVKSGEKSGELYKKLVSNSNSAEKLLSVTTYVATSAKIPMLCGYGGQDSIVGIAQFANLQNALETKGYVKDTDYKYFYFKDCGHTNLDSDETQYNNFMNEIDAWLKK